MGPSFSTPSHGRSQISLLRVTLLICDGLDGMEAQVEPELGYDGMDG